MDGDDEGVEDLKFQGLLINLNNEVKNSLYSLELQITTQVLIKGWNPAKVDA